MTELAAATAGVDVYLVAANPSTGGGGRGRGRGRDAGARGRGDDAAAARGRAGDPAGARGADPGGARGRGRGGGGGGSPAQRHSTMANLACYPALNMPNGFTAAGTPTHVTLFARPFGESELLALGRAYQEAARHHLRTPDKLDA